MTLPRTFVGFSSIDIRYYRMMCAWKAHENIEFNFADFQLEDAIDSQNEYYIKGRCRDRIRRSNTYILLIGDDTFTKTTYVKWEIEVAVEEGCRLIGVNINNCRNRDWCCPSFFTNKGALFVPFSSRIVAKALEPWRRPLPETNLIAGDWIFYDWVYTSLGYLLVGDTAVLPEVNPFLFGPPHWAR